MVEVEPLAIAGLAPVQPGRRGHGEIPVARLPTGTPVGIPVIALHGVRPGPRVWLSAAVHGDEVNGVEIIRQVLQRLDPRELGGSVVAVPIVNAFGFIHQSRYLPDRRDLNRSFPGTRNGSLASRLAHIFLTEIVDKCTHGIDLHTGSHHRTNLPQVRADLRDPETRRSAEAFGAPAMLDARTRDGSLRAAAKKRGKVVLLYEAGEPQRFDADAIRVGVEGILRVLADLDMIAPHAAPGPRRTVEIQKSSWVRARQSGILRLAVQAGDRVTRGQTLGVLGDPFGEREVRVRAPRDGLVIGLTLNPLVSRGDGILHLAAAAPDAE